MLLIFSLEPRGGGGGVCRDMWMDGDGGGGGGNLRMSWYVDGRGCAIILGTFLGVAPGFLGTFLGYSRIFGYHFLAIPGLLGITFGKIWFLSE